MLILISMTMGFVDFDVDVDVEHVLANSVDLAKVVDTAGR